MDRLKEKIISILIVLINFLFFLKLIKDGLKIQDFDYIIMFLLVLFGILIYLFYTFILDKKVYKVVFTSIFIAIIGVLMYKYKDIITIYITKDFINNILDINNALLKDKPTYFYQYKKIFFVLIPVLVSLLIVLNNLWKNSIIVFNFVAMVSFWYTVLYSSVLKNIYYFLAVSLGTFAITSFLKKLKEFRSKEIKVSLNIRHILLYSVVVSLIIVRITSILPQDYRGQSVKELTDTFQNRFAPSKRIGNLKNALIGEFDLNQSGYNDTEVKLGGPITLDRKEVFKVKSDKPYYLKGTVKDYYSKNYWLSTEGEPTPKYEDYDFEKTGLKSIGEGDGDGLIGATTKEIEIFPNVNLNSTSFFTPNNGFDIISDYKGVFYTKTPTFINDVDVRNPYLVKFFSYKGYENYVEGIQNRPSSVTIKEENYKLPIRQENEPYLNYEKRVNSLDINNFEKSQLTSILDNYESYFQLDSEISSEVYDLLDKILSSTGKEKEKLTNYEKALAIRNYLTKNYPYTLQVSEIPEGKDFVSFFLLEEKKGYCTYFASATTILCRIAGIPARYVQGFKTPDKTDGEGKYIVTNAEAHAWCEILINPEKDLWVVVDPSPTPTEFEALNNSAENGEEKVEEGNKENENNKEKPNRKNPMEEELEEDSWDLRAFNLNYNLFCSIAIPTTILLYIIYRILKVRRHIKYVYLSSSVVPLYQYCLERLETIDIIKPESSGDLEFIEAVKDGSLKERLIVLGELSYEEYYGGINRNTLEKKQEIIFFENYIKSKEKRISYFMKKYFGFN